MSAKDDFFNKLQQGRIKREDQENKVKDDIQYFIARLYELVKEIEGWLYKADLKIEIVETHHKDESIASNPELQNLSTYKAHSITITNGAKLASLVPLTVYGGNAGGWCRLTVQSSRGVEKYNLKLKKDDHNWTIKQEVDWIALSPMASRRPMALPEEEFTEDTFFKAIMGIVD
ncbi:hypothetical protein [Klebsiella variicola]|uniref:hypothetical protein n=1 Tax=Klebsiella variicola TaxID=244366 RepID=UPI000C7B0BA3|nr:hypothetical protein [Klebsiella variicola]